MSEVPNYTHDTVENTTEKKEDVVDVTHDQLSDLAKMVMSTTDTARETKFSQQDVFKKKAQEITHSVLAHFWGQGKVTKDQMSKSEIAVQDTLKKTDTQTSSDLEYGARQAINMKIPIPAELLPNIPVVTAGSDDAQKQKVEEYRKNLEQALLAKAGLPEGYRVFYAKDTKNQSLIVRFLPELRTGQGPTLQKNVLKDEFGVEDPVLSKPKTGVSGTSEKLPSSIEGTVKEMYEYLTAEKGISRVHALGLIANIQRESGFNTKSIGDGGTSGGLFQWHAERMTKMIAAVPDWKNNWKGQIDYALQENGLSRNYLANSFSTPEEAAGWWTQYWERPADVSGAKMVNNQHLGSYDFLA